ncbi:hypothetical protein [Hoeflea sp.]|uniref:hypothetical protein n=1 Tax=Hoeflea sp. TaxID=1940281 RepID=UPI003B516CAC
MNEDSDQTESDDNESQHAEKEHFLPSDHINTRDLENSIDSNKKIDIKSIGISYLNHRTRKSTKLVSKKDEKNYITSRNKWMSFDFRDMIYLNKISVFCDGFGEFDEMELSAVDAFTGTEIRRTGKSSEGTFIFELKVFTSGFGLLPPAKFFSRATIKNIQIQGYDIEQVHEALTYVDSSESYKAKIVSECQPYIQEADEASENLKKLETVIAEKEIDLNGKLVNLSELEDEIRILSSNLESESNKLTKTERQVIERRSDLSLLDGEIEKRASTRKILAEEISSKESELRNLENDINLFPSEIAGYVTQGAKNVKTYVLLSFIPSLIIVILTWRLIANSEQIVHFFNNDNSVSIFEFLLSRTPYVLVSFAVIGVCYTFVHRLISEIININRRRQDLFKINIIATDVSSASASGLDLDENEKYILRTQIKMEMMREHLRRHMGEGYKFAQRGSILGVLSDITTSTTSANHKDDEEVDHEDDANPPSEEPNPPSEEPSKDTA